MKTIFLKCKTVWIIFIGAITLLLGLGYFRAKEFFSKFRSIWFFFGGIAMLLSGCATVFEGTSQPVSVTLEPSSTVCRAYRDNRELGALTHSNPVIYTQRSSKELTLVCSARGYKPRMLKLVSNPSGLGAIGAVAGGTGVVNTLSNELGWDNIVANSKSTTTSYLGLIPGVVDILTGAYWSYDNQINIVLEPNS
tara:strand:+ start:29 stop:610 length:582 start_codon:yes stop_codon:yes gene_type:complete